MAKVLSAVSVIAQADMMYESVVGVAINATLKWSPMPDSDKVSMCLSANTFDGNDGWIGIGFGGQHGNGKKWMLDEDCVVGYTNAQGEAVVEAMYADQESGMPSGDNFLLSVSDGTFTNENGIMEVCFTRNISDGHNPLGDGAKVIWATGGVVNGTMQYHGKDGHDDSGESQMHRSDEVPSFNWISGPFPEMQYESVIGEAINATLQWTPQVQDDLISMCVSANTFEGNDGWIGIGFGGDHGNGKKWMLDEDCVVGYAGADGMPVLEAMYAEKESGLPDGANWLNINGGTFTNENGVMKMCFSRKISEGHNPLDDGAKVIWATGAVINGTMQYHGIDGHDDTGTSQMHRSDEVPSFNWLSGPAQSVVV